ncbi:MAG: hypothetical protein EYC70_04260 [Planctomycetota bacterium]|nr:MAG: hypothetical protein EYC70_04260 [Planctomycetota bacterium]
MAKATTARSAGLGTLLRKLHKPTYRVPPRESDENALERLLALVLQGEDPYSVARQAVKVLRRSYAHWNEVRVARRFEVRDALALRRVPQSEERALKAQEFLRRVFGLQNHLDLDWLYDATSERREKLLASLTVAPEHAAPVLDLDAALSEGADRLPPVSTDLKRSLARLSLTPSSPKDGQVLDLIAPHLKGEKLYPNYLALQMHARLICESKHPRCRQCPVLEGCPHGKRALGSEGYRVALEEMSAAARKAGAGEDSAARGSGKGGAKGGGKGRARSSSSAQRA